MLGRYSMAVCAAKGIGIVIVATIAVVSLLRCPTPTCVVVLLKCGAKAERVVVALRLAHQPTGTSMASPLYVA